MIRSECWVALLVVALAAPVSAAPSSVEKSTADALFKEGKKLLDAKDYDAACPKLAESARLQPGGGVQLALALCHEGQGRLATAWNDYREALALAKRDKRQDREEIATAKLAELEPRIAKLTIQLSDGAKAQSPTVKLDDAVLPSASFGVAIRVDRGNHTLVVSATGKITKTIELPIADKDEKTVVVAPLADEPQKPADPVKPTEPVKPVDSAPSSGPSRVGPIVLGSAGIVLVGLGAFFGLKAMSTSSDVRANCPGGACTSPEWVDKNDDARRSALFANLGVGVGALALAGAAVWWFATPKEQPVAVAVGPTEVRMVVRW